uniref:hypothetical protein n=1 Tax=uncultured Draconibacterium sp. TaxID=1573823 RepID=UPI00321633E5
MKQSLLAICLILLISFSLFAQKNEPIKVKAGTRLTDYFEPNERYLYPDFINGKAKFRNGKTYRCRFNYNFLSGEMEFIEKKDTLTIIDKNELLSIVIKQDTFYYENGYLQQIQNGFIKVYSKQFIKLKDIQKKGAMGTINRSSATESIKYWQSGSLSYDLISDTDIILQKEEQFFFSLSQNNFTLFNRSNLFALLPWKKADLKSYIKSNKINFKSKKDVLELANYINQFLAKK